MENKLFGVSAAPLTDPAPEPELFPFKVVLGNTWAMKLNMDDFVDWKMSQGITPEDWDFQASGLVDFNPIIAFKREDDAVAFSLKFGL